MIPKAEKNQTNIEGKTNKQTNIFEYILSSTRAHIIIWCMTHSKKRANANTQGKMNSSLYSVRQYSIEMAVHWAELICGAHEVWIPKNLIEKVNFQCEII